jgi:uncharacterized protein (DUF885 family)
MHHAVLSALLFVIVTMSLHADTPAASDLHRLFDEHFEWRARNFPESAIERGDYRFADRLTDNSLAAIEQRAVETQDFLDRAMAIDRESLSEQDLVSLELFQLELETTLGEHRFRTFLMPVGPTNGPHRDLPQLGDRARFGTAEHYRHYLSRLAGIPAYIDNTIEAMRLGLREGRTPPRVAVRHMPGQLSAMASTGAERLGEPFLRFPAVVPESERARIQGEFERDVKPRIEAAFHRFRDFIATEYVPNCVESTAATDLPDGAAFYNFCLRQFTTTDLTAAEIHEIGLSEVARLRGEMMDVIRRTDFMDRPEAREAAAAGDDALFAVFLHYLRTDPRFYYTDPADLLRDYRDICKRMDAELPRLFGRLPRLSYGVTEMPAFIAPTQTSAYYQPGDLRNAEPGFFVVNTYALDQRPKYEMQALAFHEAVPGHHFQIALAKELEDLPEFRKEAYFVAFGEGWALYAERLGLESGFYTDPYDDFGRLLFEMWRACRLVVDPGMHALGWSRDRAVRFMLDNTALSELNINNEVDRYIAWPGQACGYKIGELKIRELRALAERELGPAFDRRAFHDVVLGAGTVPLSVLDRRVTDWVRAPKP